MALQSFFLRGHFLGARSIPDNRVVPGLEIRRHFSYVRFCMRCGEIWSRFLHDGAELTQIICTPCLEHGDGRLAAPRDSSDDPLSFSEDWPDKAISYEFRAMMSLAERELSGEDRCASPGALWRPTLAKEPT